MGFSEILRFFENVVAIAVTLSILTLLVGLLRWAGFPEDLLTFSRRVLAAVGIGGRPTSPSIDKTSASPSVNVEWRDVNGVLMLLTEFVRVSILNGRGRSAHLVDGVFIGCDSHFRPGTHCKVVVEGGAFIEPCIVQVDLHTSVLFVQSAVTACGVLARITSGAALHRARTPRQLEPAD